jgi:hypothetical protein
VIVPLLTSCRSGYQAVAEGVVEVVVPIELVVVVGDAAALGPPAKKAAAVPPPAKNVAATRAPVANLFCSFFWFISQLLCLLRR